MKTIMVLIILMASASAFSTSLYRGEYESAHCESSDGRVVVELVLHTEYENHIFLGFPTVGGYAKYKAVKSASQTYRNGVKYTAKFTGGNMSLDMEAYSNANKNNRKATFVSQSYGAPAKKVAVVCSVPLHHRH